MDQSAAQMLDVIRPGSPGAQRVRPDDNRIDLLLSTYPSPARPADQFLITMLSNPLDAM